MTNILRTHLSQQALKSELITTTFKRNQPAFAQVNATHVMNQPQIYQNQQTFRDNDSFFNPSVDVQSLLEENKILGMKKFYPFMRDDSFRLMYSASQFMSYFDENFESNDNKYRDQGLENILGSSKPNSSNKFDCLNLECVDPVVTCQNSNLGQDYLMDDNFTTGAQSPFDPTGDIVLQDQEQDFFNEQADASPYPNDYEYQDSASDIKQNQQSGYQDQSAIPLPVCQSQFSYRKNLLKLTTHYPLPSHSIYKKNKEFEEIDACTVATADEKYLCLNKQSSSNLITRKSSPHEHTTDTSSSHSSDNRIGALSHSERMQKILNYLRKKNTRSQKNKFCYKCRKQVAEKRLRIKGRFVTRSQAYVILGINSDELKSNEILQKLLENQVEGSDSLQLNSLFESEGGKKQIKIRNFQALIDDNYNHNSRLFTKEQSFGGSTNASDDTSAFISEDNSKQFQLNLRISTTQTHNSQSGQNHVSKIQIQNFPGAKEEKMTNNISMDEALKQSLSNLKLEGYVQPLFKVEKFVEAKKI